MLGHGSIPRSTLEDLTFQTASGGSRNYDQDPKRAAAIRFDTLEIHFVMDPIISSAEAIPDPQDCEEWTRVLRRWPELRSTSAKVRQ